MLPADLHFVFCGDRKRPQDSHFSDFLDGQNRQRCRCGEAAVIEQQTRIVRQSPRRPNCCVYSIGNLSGVQSPAILFKPHIRLAGVGFQTVIVHPVADMNEAVLQAFEKHALTPKAIEQVVQLTERDDVAELQDKLAHERKDIEKRIGRLVAAIETGGEAASLVAKLRELETRRSAIDAEAVGLHPVPRLPPAVLERRLAEWRRLLRQSTTQGRTVLQRILSGRLTFTPRVNPVSGEPDGYDFEGPTRFDKLITGIAVERPKSLAHGDIAGCEGIGPEDTFDGDYGRLLERVHVKGDSSPAGSAGGWISPIRCDTRDAA